MEVICQIEECVWCSSVGYCTSDQIEIDIKSTCVNVGYEKEPTDD